MLRKFSLIALSTISVFAMHSAEININDKDLELSAKFDLGQFGNTVEPDTTFLGFSYINGHEDNSNTDINGYVETNFLMRREVENSGVMFGIGVKSNYTKINADRYITIPLGLELGYTLSTTIPITFGTKLYYAPESLAFSKAKSFLEYRFDATVAVIDTGSLLLGYRNIDTNMENRYGTQTYNKSIYFGFRFAF
ncbi:MAG: YfaZ family outer membrane protein [Campylobacterota bacterium]|nr:YfaZ family outer membrane protein [Campylobacterota bacterium]